MFAGCWQVGFRTSKPLLFWVLSNVATYQASPFRCGIMAHRLTNFNESIDSVAASIVHQKGEEQGYLKDAAEAITTYGRHANNSRQRDL